MLAAATVATLTGSSPASGSEYHQRTRRNDRICGGTGNDRLIGGTGNAVLLGGNEDDAIDGDVGVDTANFASAPAGVIAELLRLQHLHWLAGAAG
jgi:Ca2+-binding RTX toxin-like protein